ncbi:hypothetical protein DITRI_Ditri13aG0167800 [Diplodiscus trichospermus]
MSLSTQSKSETDAALDESSLAQSFHMKANNDITSVTSNGGRVQCIKVWPLLGKKKFETLPYLLTLTQESLGYYDGRYWTMWKLPMFGCTEASQVLKELEKCKKEYPMHLSESSDSTTSVKCSSLVSLPTSLQATKLRLVPLVGSRFV